MSFGITSECDLKCPHCYSDSGEKDENELSTDEAKDVIRQAGELGVHLLILDGGEPTLRKDLPELVTHARDCGIRPVLGSNGMSLSLELAGKLKNAGCEAVAISLDGINVKTHDDFRGAEGAWAKAVEGARNCARVGMGFQIAPLVHRGNWTELPAVAAFAKELGAGAVELFDFVAAGRGKQHLEYELDTEQRRGVIADIIKWQRSDDIIYRVIGLPQYWPAVEREVPEDEILARFVRSCCAAGSRYITVLPNGDVIPCMVLQVKLGNIREIDLKTIWHDSPELKALRNRDLLKGKCGRCKYRYVCGGARCKAYEKTGDFLTEDPTCWFSEEEIAEGG